MRQKAIQIPSVVILGGSFNPPHIMHFRLAIEAMEAFSPERLLFVPVGEPPHKEHTVLLPFSVRAEMLESVLASFPGMEVCRIEAERSGPSYTFDTLVALAERYPGKRFGFIMGSEDLAGLSTWYRWQELPGKADLLLIARGADSFCKTESIVQELWPGATPFALEAAVGKGHSRLLQGYSLPSGGTVFYLPQPSLEVSSSLIRQYWLQGKSLDFLVPEAVLKRLSVESALLQELWGTPSMR